MVFAQDLNFKIEEDCKELVDIHDYQLTIDQLRNSITNVKKRKWAFRLMIMMV